MKRSFAAMLVAGLAAAPAAEAAMRLSAQDLGQVLLFPYYTVQKNQSTLVSIVNTTDQAKALDVQFREARNGNVAVEITLFLGPHDTWSASVVGLTSGGAAFLNTGDRSCTIPYVFDSPYQVGGRSYHEFENTAADGGPVTADRTREGYLQVVEHGVISPSSPLHALLSSPQGSPASMDCESLSTLERSDLAPPTGGLYGAFGIVDANGGTVIAGAATAIDGFSNDVVLSPAQEMFYLGFGNHGSRLFLGHIASRVAEAEVRVGGRTVTLGYDDVERSRTDAVSALLMADSVYGNYSGSSSAWVITSPTKHRYVDQALLALWSFEPAARAPYREMFSETEPGKSCVPYRVAAYDRDQRALVADTAARQLCYSVDVLSFAPASAGPALGSAVSQSLWDYTQGAAAGSLQLSPGLAADGTSSVLPAALDHGTPLRGLPVIGFEAMRQLGRNPPGLISSYAYTVPLRSRTSCADASGAAVACP